MLFDRRSARRVLGRLWATVLDVEGAVWHQYQRGLMRAARGDFAGAAERFERALTLAERTGGHLRFEWQVRGALGRSLWKLADHDKGRRSLQEALSICPAEPGDDAGRGWILHQLGELELDLGRFDEAGRYFEQAAEEQGRVGASADQASSLVGAAVSYHGKPDGAATIRQLIRYFEIPAGERRQKSAADEARLAVLVSLLEADGQSALAGRYRGMRAELVPRSDPELPRAPRPRYRTWQSELRACTWVAAALTATLGVSLGSAAVARMFSVPGPDRQGLLYPELIAVPLVGPSIGTLVPFGLGALLLLFAAVYYLRRAHLRLDSSPVWARVALGLFVGGYIVNSSELLTGSMTQILHVERFGGFGPEDLAAWAGGIALAVYVWRS